MAADTTIYFLESISPDGWVLADNRGVYFDYEHVKGTAEMLNKDYGEGTFRVATFVRKEDK